MVKRRFNPGDKIRIPNQRTVFVVGNKPIGPIVVRDNAKEIAARIGNGWRHVVVEMQGRQTNYVIPPGMNENFEME